MRETWTIWWRAARSAAAWRLLLLWLVGLSLPSLASLLPLNAALRPLLDFSPRAHELAGRLDGTALVDLLSIVDRPVAAAGTLGVLGATLLLTVALSPALAGATVTAARGRVRFGELCAGAGALYLPLLRLTLFSLLPSGAATALGGVFWWQASEFSRHTTSAVMAERAHSLGWLVLIALLFLAHATLEAARAELGVRPSQPVWAAYRRGLRLIVERPVGTLGLCLGTWLLGLCGAALAMLVRYWVQPSVGSRLALAFVLSQIALVVLGWTRSSRLCGLVAMAARR